MFDGLRLTVPLLLFQSLASGRQLLAFPTGVRVARQVFVQHVNQTLFRLLQAGQYMAPVLIVALSIGEHLFDVREELLYRAVIATGALALHSLEVHGVADDLKIIFSFLCGHWLPAEEGVTKTRQKISARH